MLSRGQRLARAARQATAEARLNILEHASADGLSKAQAAMQARMTVSGANSLLFRVFGSTAWPIRTRGDQ